jgi:ribose/xylose/arabinose/galactoside ABC-type transport system permease subunit
MSSETTAAIAERARNYDISEFLQGMRDAKEGVTHQSKNPSYDAGYSSQYELEAIMSSVLNGAKR